MSVYLPPLRGAFSVGGNFPPDIGNRVFWWDTTGQAGGTFLDTTGTIPAANNTRVASIRGAEGTLFNNTLGATRQPTFFVNRQNAQPGLYFERGRNTFLDIATAGFLATAQAKTKMTLLVVWKPQAYLAAAMRFRGAASQGLRIGTDTGNTVTGYRRGNQSAGNAVSVSAATDFSQASAALLSWTGHGGTMRLDDNHTNNDTAASDSAEGAGWDQGRIGCVPDPSDAFQGDLYEIIWWDDAADAGQRTAALAYATAKWNLT